MDAPNGKVFVFVLDDLHQESADVSAAIGWFGSLGSRRIRSYGPALIMPDVHVVPQPTMNE